MVSCPYPYVCVGKGGGGSLLTPLPQRPQETKTITTARKVMESRGVVHYFDMVVNAGGDGLGVGI